MPEISKLFKLTITPEQFLDSCSQNELKEIDLLIQSPRFRNIISTSEFLSVEKSINAVKLSKKINDKFNLKITPRIQRFLKEDYKFKMIDQKGEIFFFKGTVLDFLSKEVEIQKNGNIFTIN